MIVYLIGAGIVYAALVASSLLVKTSDWWEVHPTAGAAVLTLGLVPMLATWVAAETAKVVRAPRVLTRHAGVARRLLGGFGAGILTTIVGALSIVLLEPAQGGFGWLFMGASALLATSALLMTARTVKRGHCSRCDYDLAGVTPAANGRCPECGLDVMVAQ